MTVRVGEPEGRPGRPARAAIMIMMICDDLARASFDSESAKSPRIGSASESASHRHSTGSPEPSDSEPEPARLSGGTQR